VRQSETGQLGVQGEAAVKLAFTELGWAVATADQGSDLGTDIFLLVRDNRLFDLGLLIGVQVKAGESFFKSPKRDESGEVVGWWFQRDRAHFDYWLSHALPHLIVLHNPSGGSYWAHVTDESVVSTGKGAKVFVPVENTIDLDHRNALLEVAATARPASTWEGSAWTGAGHVAPADLLRHALVVPRLVAPHPNAGLGQSVGAEQVVALLVQARLNDIERFAQKYPQVVPTLQEAADSADWMWRFVSALSARITTDTVDPLLVLARDAPTPPTRAAATVAGAASLLEHARPDEALDLLQTALNRDDNAPVDHAWLMTQHVRACLEVGRIDDARASALQVQEVRLSHGNDVTATAIAGTAALLLFTVSDWGSGDTEQAVIGLDTTAVWWRFQHAAAGSSAAIEREFMSWCRPSATTVISGGDTANNQLFTAALLASHLGDHAAWRRLESLNVKRALLQVGRTSEPDQVCELLGILRRSGDDEALGRSVRRFVIDGPAVAVTTAAAQIDFTQWTRSTSRTNLILLQRGGDVLDAATAGAAVGWLLATLTDDTAFHTRTRPTFAVRLRLVDTLAGVAPAAPPDHQSAIAEFVLALPPQDDLALATSWAGLVHALPASLWSGLAARAVTAADAHHDVLRRSLLAVAAPTNLAARNSLLDEIRSSKSLTALAALNEVDLPDDVVGELITILEPLVTNRISDAQQATYATGAVDVGRTLAVLNAAHPDIARWESIYALLEEPQVVADDKRDVCRVLASSVDRLRPEVKAKLNSLAPALLSHPAALADRVDGLPGVLEPAAYLAVKLGIETVTTELLLVRLLAGDVADRGWATKLATHLAPSVAAGVLVPLTEDPEPSVRASAASAMAWLVVTGTAETLASVTLGRSVKDPGTLVPRHIAKVLAGQTEPTTAAVHLLRGLAEHCAATVRATVATALAAVG
jgi:hypothetical protein